MSSYPPPPDAPHVLPGEDGGAYACRKAEAAAIADAARLPEWVLLAEVARRGQGRPAPDDAALAERLHDVYNKACEDEHTYSWLRVAAEARAALAEPVGHTGAQWQDLCDAHVAPIVDPGVTDSADVARATGARLSASASDAFRGTMAIEERDLPRNADLAAVALPWCACAEPSDIMYGGHRGVCATCGH